MSSEELRVNGDELAVELRYGVHTYDDLTPQVIRELVRRFCVLYARLGYTSGRYWVRLEKVVPHARVDGWLRLIASGQFTVEAVCSLKELGSDLRFSTHLQCPAEVSPPEFLTQLAEIFDPAYGKKIAEAARAQRELPTIKFPDIPSQQFKALVSGPIPHEIVSFFATVTAHCLKPNERGSYRKADAASAITRVIEAGNCGSSSSLVTVMLESLRRNGYIQFEGKDRFLITSKLSGIVRTALARGLPPVEPPKVVSVTRKDMPTASLSLRQTSDGKSEKDLLLMELALQDVQKSERERYLRQLRAQQQLADLDRRIAELQQARAQQLVVLEEINRSVEEDDVSRRRISLAEAIGKLRRQLRRS